MDLLPLYAENTRAANTECGADNHCISKSCNLDKKRCRATIADPCDPAVGCSGTATQMRPLFCIDGACKEVGDGTERRRLHQSVVQHNKPSLCRRDEPALRRNDQVRCDGVCRLQRRAKSPSRATIPVWGDFVERASSSFAVAAIMIPLATSSRNTTATRIG